jgi:hypothetical protein
MTDPAVEAARKPVEDAIRDCDDSSDGLCGECAITLLAAHTEAAVKVLKDQLLVQQVATVTQHDLRTEAEDRERDLRAQLARWGHDWCDQCDKPQWVLPDGDHACASYADLRAQLAAAEGERNKWVFAAQVVTAERDSLRAASEQARLALTGMSYLAYTHPHLWSKDAADALAALMIPIQKKTPQQVIRDAGHDA